ncbi:MAG TPA: hypothetical protein PKW69_15110, partial [Niabella sp.]|nr:hypothetical protein [Niabella sp.]
TILLRPFTELGQEVVVSASRTAERMLNSAVTVERVSSAAIRNTPAVGYYDIISNIKGVNVVNSSLTFTSPTTRGFSGSGNTRFNQIVDGIDNQAPAQCSRSIRTGCRKHGIIARCIFGIVWLRRYEWHLAHQQ